MRLRLAVTVALALLLGAWAYLDEWTYQQGGSLATAVDSAPVVVAIFVITILAGALVGRAWVLLALLGPIASLAYLESTGHRGPDGISPLTSAPGIFLLVWLALLLALGIALASLWRFVRDQSNPAPS